MTRVTYTGTLQQPTSASGYGVTLSAEDLAAILAEQQGRDIALGYTPRASLDANQIIQHLSWKAEELGLTVPDDTDPDPREDPRL